MFHFLNDDLLGYILYFFSKSDNWFPIYLYILYLIFKYEKRNALHIIVFVGIILFLSQQIGSGNLKSLIYKFNPYNQVVDLNNLVGHMEGYVSKIGSISTQAVQSFAVSIFLKKVLNRKCRKFFLVFSWPLFISLSQCAVKIHSLNDVCTGAAIGSILGLFSFSIFKKRKVVFKKILKYFVGTNIFK